MRKLFVLMILIAGVLSTSAIKAQSATNYEKAVAEYLELTNAKKTLKITLVEAYNAMNLPIQNMDGMVTDLLDTIWPDYIVETSKVMSDYYSLDEINQINDFYKTPIGIKFASNSPEVAQKLTTIMMQPKFQNQIQNVILKYL